ncbi:hypothetical protein NDU88_000584 [Pleurodeles waltl]|uniref:C-type lectin domain-containing protein n=1 Tax=Pleurodeles waltl TaxID=8319 RepID=A0AAV7P4K6_PLEWA|nr:hypothetical protein NDU88_000584 [Pleurodeles waltl]
MPFGAGVQMSRSPLKRRLSAYYKERGLGQLPECVRNVPDRMTDFRLEGRVAVLSITIMGLLAWIVVVHIKWAKDKQILKECEQSCALKGEVLPPCGDDWMWYRHKCFYFSEYAGTWTEAKDSCAALDSFLVLIDAPKELDFLLRHKGDPDLWIGLRRTDPGLPWLWVNGSRFNNW